MSVLQLFGAFRAYGPDVLLLALGVTLLVSLLKKTVLKGAPKQIFVFLPFAVGLVLYAVFRALVTMSDAPFTTELMRTFEGGFACGCAATLYYVVYEQFFRGKTVSPLWPLLEGIVPDKVRTEAAQALYGGSLPLTREERISFFKEQLNVYADPPMSEDALQDTAVLLADFMESLGK